MNEQVGRIKRSECGGRRKIGDGACFPTKREGGVARGGGNRSVDCENRGGGKSEKKMFRRAKHDFTNTDVDIRHGLGRLPEKRSSLLIANFDVAFCVHPCNNVFAGRTKRLDELVRACGGDHSACRNGEWEDGVGGAAVGVGPEKFAAVSVDAPDVRLLLNHEDVGSIVDLRNHRRSRHVVTVAVVHRIDDVGSGSVEVEGDLASSVDLENFFGSQGIDAGDGEILGVGKLIENDVASRRRSGRGRDRSGFVIRLGRVLPNYCAGFDGDGSEDVSGGLLIPAVECHDSRTLERELRDRSSGGVEGAGDVELGGGVVDESAGGKVDADAQVEDDAGGFVDDRLHDHLAVDVFGQVELDGPFGGAINAVEARDVGLGGVSVNDEVVGLGSLEVDRCGVVVFGSVDVPNQFVRLVVSAGRVGRIRSDPLTTVASANFRRVIAAELATERGSRQAAAFGITVARASRGAAEAIFSLAADLILGAALRHAVFECLATRAALTAAEGGGTRSRAHHAATGLREAALGGTDPPCATLRDRGVHAADFHATRAAAFLVGRTGDCFAVDSLAGLGCGGC